MKSFLLRFKGTTYFICFGADSKNDVKMSEKKHVVYVYGPFDRVWAEEPPLRFSWIKEHMFIYLQTYYEKHWILRIFFRFFLFRFLTRVPMENYLPVWALYMYMYRYVFKASWFSWVYFFINCCYCIVIPSCTFMSIVIFSPFIRDIDIKELNWQWATAVTGNMQLCLHVSLKSQMVHCSQCVAFENM